MQNNKKNGGYSIKIIKNINIPPPKKMRCDGIYLNFIETFANRIAALYLKSKYATV